MWSEEGRLLSQAEGRELPAQLNMDLPGIEAESKIGGILVTQDVLGNKSRQEISDFFPKAAAGSATETEEESKSATETWVNEF
jgi:hypothetical protein